MAEAKLSPDDTRQGTDPGLTPARGACCAGVAGYQPPKTQEGLQRGAGAFAWGSVLAPSIRANCLKGRVPEEAAGG